MKTRLTKIVAAIVLVALYSVVSTMEYNDQMRLAELKSVVK